jgi:hypothetical protein
MEVKPRRRGGVWGLLLPSLIVRVPFTISVSVKSTEPFILKITVKGDHNGAAAQKPKPFWADAPFSTPQQPFLGH